MEKQRRPQHGGCVRGAGCLLATANEAFRSDCRDQRPALGPVLSFWLSGFSAGLPATDGSVFRTEGVGFSFGRQVDEHAFWGVGNNLTSG